MLDLPPARFDGVLANASLFHVPRRDLPRVLGELHATLRPRGMLFASSPRGQDVEGWQGERYGVWDASMMRPRTTLATSLVLALVGIAFGQALAASPCVANATDGARACAKVCGIARKLDRSGCVARDVTCLAVCKTHLNGCRGVGGIEQGFGYCAQTFEDARIACLGEFPDIASPPFAACLGPARRDASKCRAGSLRLARPGSCRGRFHDCGKACPATPSRFELDECRLAVATTYLGCRARCAADLTAAQQICDGRQEACVSTCDDTLETCSVISPANRDVILTCKLASRDALEHCRLPDSAPSCHDDALDAFAGCVGPVQGSMAGAFVDCALAYDGCIDACPSSTQDLSWIPQGHAETRSSIAPDPSRPA